MHAECALHTIVYSSFLNWLLSGALQFVLLRCTQMYAKSYSADLHNICRYSVPMPSNNYCSTAVSYINVATDDSANTANYVYL